MLTPRLRFGVIVDRPWLPAWQLAVISALFDHDDTELALVVEARDPTPEETRSRQASLWRLYNNGVVARRARSVRRAALWDDVAPGSRRLITTVERRGRWSQHFRTGDIETIRDAELHFILRFGLGIIRGEILDTARHGVWSFHHDDERVIRGGPPSFWELYEGLPTTGVLLQRLTDRLDGGVPLARATFRSVLHSYPRNRDRVSLGAAVLPALVARAIRTGTLDPATRTESTSDAPIRHNPTNGEMARFLTCQARRAITTRVRGVARADVWTVGVVKATNASNGKHMIDQVEWLPERGDNGYFADPFVARRDGRTAILVEDFDEAENRGVISALEQDGDGWTVHHGVIDPGVHASYPYLFTDDGELYCVPETWQLRRVELWRCREFPTQWQREAVLVDNASIVDPTLVQHNSTWWLFGTRKDDEPDTKLYLWCAPVLKGPWEPHPLNPVKIDVVSSRPAGTPIVDDGVLYRPAQDCSTAYGSAVVWNRVDRLSEAGLVETTTGRLVAPPGKYASGTHTFACSDGLAVIDGRRYGTSRHRVLREVRARLTRLGRRFTD